MKIKKATARMMMNQQAKWRKQAEKPAKWNEGYAGVTYADFGTSMTAWQVSSPVISMLFSKQQRDHMGDVQPFCTMVTRMKPINAGYRLFAI